MAALNGEEIFFFSTKNERQIDERVKNKMALERLSRTLFSRH